jgi:hypothetical protein
MLLATKSIKYERPDSTRNRRLTKSVSSEQLENSLRAEVDAHVHSRLQGLQEDIARLQSELNEAFTRLMERTASMGQADAPFVAAVSDHIRAARERGIEMGVAEAPGTRSASNVALLKFAIEELDSQQSQASILDALVNRAASFAPRILFLIIKNGQARGWRARGLAGTVGDEVAQEIGFPLSTNTVVGEVARSRATWSGQATGHGDNHLLLDKLGEPQPQRIVAIPMMARGRAVAVLYADSAGLDAGAINLEALEILVRVASMAIELLAAPQAAAQPEAAPQQQRQEEVAQEADEQASAPAAAASQQQQQVPEAAFIPPAQRVTAELIAPPAETFYEPTFAAEPNAPESISSASPVTNFAPSVSAQPETIPAILEPMPSVAPPVAPATPPPPPSPAASTTADSGSAARRYGRAAEAELPVEVSEDERRLHYDARRFARLLVSEIKLYNEQRVKEGRAESNIYDLLREDIDRSREMYNKRVAKPVASRYDYFHQELVNTLAEGDAGKMGNSYPGANV